MMREHDWSTSSLGSPESWPQSLRSVVGLMLNSRFPMFAAWGEGLGFVYNDAYVEILGEKHPSALGRRFHDIWSEIWSDISPLINSAMAGDATYRENLPLTMNRKGYDEQTWFTFSYSPVQDESGAVAGMFCACTETTEAVRAQQRQTFRLELEVRLRDVADPSAVMDAAVALLGRQLRANRVGYGEVQADDVTVVLHSCYADGVAPLEGEFPLDGFGPAMIARQRQGLTQSSADVNDDLDQDPAFWATINTRAFVSVPLVRDGRFAASLYVNAREPHAWAADEIALIEETAARTWSAVEHARADAALRERESQFRALVNATANVVYRMGPDWREMRRLGGAGFIVDTEDPTIDWVETYIPADERPRVRDAIERAIADKDVFELEHRVLRADGTVGWTHSRAIPILDNAGGIVEWLGAASDVTARVKADQSFTRLFEASPAPFLVLAPDAPRFTITEVNDAYLAATMRTREGVAKRGIFEAYPDNPNDPTIGGVSRLRASLERVLATRRPDELSGLKYDVVRPDGTYEERWWSSVNSPVLNENGEVEAIIHNANDVTEDRRAEAALNESEERQAFLLKLSDVLRPLAEPLAVQVEAMRVLGQHLAVSRAQYHEIEPNNEWIKPGGGYANGVPLHPGSSRMDDFGAFVRDAYEGGRTLVVSDTALDTRISAAERAAFAGIGVRAFVAVPLVKNGRFVGILGLDHVTARSWSQVEIALAEETAERTWAAVERAQAEAALRQGEALLSAVLDSLPVGVILADAQGRITRDNAVNRELWGVPPEMTGFEQYGEWVGWWPATGERIAGTDWAMARALLHGETVKNELIENQRFGTGERRFILNNAAPVRDTSGAIVAGVVAQMDVTDRLAAERALKQLNETLEARVVERTAERDRLWQSSQDLLMVARFDGTVVTVNPAWATTLGWSEAEMIGMQFWTLIHPGDVAACQVHAIALSTGMQTSARFECRYHAKSGDWHWLAWSVTSGAGLFNGVARDVTDEKMRAAELAQRTAERDQVWKTSRDLLMIADLDGVLRAANPGWTRTLGYTEAETVGRSFRDFIVLDDIYSTEEALATAASGANVDGFDNRYLHKDGSIRHLAWHTSAENGLIYAFGRDITDERAREAEVRAMEEHLRQSQKMEAMGQLTGGVAHDFNNLLTPIVYGLELARRAGFGTEREQRIIAGAIQSADRATTLVHRLLSFARRQPLQSTGVDLTQLLRGMAGLLSSTTGPQITVMVDAPDTLPLAKADANQLEMAILNLAINARDAMPNGGTLQMALSSQDVEERRQPHDLAPGPYLRLSIADTGEGMDEATIKRAVEPFFSTKGVGKGTGLGLSMAHGLAAQLGGTLTISSTRGAGTTIEFWLPQSAKPVNGFQPVADAAVSVTGSGIVLLVDDEELVRLSTADMLTTLGFDVVEAGSAEDALKLVEHGLQPDFLVTDHLMPGMSGTKLARMLKNIRPTIKVIILSGYAEAEGISPDLPRLAKPFRNTELAASLAALT